MVNVMDKIREEFEAWMSEYFNGTSIDRRAHGYIDQISDAMWISWQASRSALCVAIPSAWNRDQVEFKSEVYDALDSVGVSYK